MEAYIATDVATPVWYLNDVRIQGQNGKTFAPVEMGLYHIRYYLLKPNGDTCWSYWESNKVLFQNFITAATPSQEATDQCIVYPVPSSNDVYIDYSENIQAVDIKNISLYDLTGKVLKIYVPVFIKENTMVIDISDFCSGLYLVKIETSQTIYSRKICKK